jgi:hypothetical protein
MLSQENVRLFNINVVIITFKNPFVATSGKAAWNSPPKPTFSLFPRIEGCLVLCHLHVGQT